MLSLRIVVAAVAFAVASAVNARVDIFSALTCDMIPAATFTHSAANGGCKNLVQNNALKDSSYYWKIGGCEDAAAGSTAALTVAMYKKASNETATPACQNTASSVVFNGMKDTVCYTVGGASYRVTCLSDTTGLGVNGAASTAFSLLSVVAVIAAAVRMAL